MLDPQMAEAGILIIILNVYTSLQYDINRNSLSQE